MTAFSRQEQVVEWGTLIWEIRSVNHRYLDVAVRLSEDFRAIEPQVRERLSKKISRGKLEASLRFKASQNIASTIVLNQQLAEQLANGARELQRFTGEEAPISAMDVLRWPGVVSQAEADFGPIHQAALALLDKTITDFIATREREGEKTAQMLSERCEAIETNLQQVRELRPQAADKQREKLLARLADIKVEHDSSRLEQELVYIAQKLDVDEELDRLTAHISELRSVLKRKEPVGRRLDFLVQEFNREGNTLGSKSADAQITALTVDIKVLIEQMREQVQNIE